MQPKVSELLNKINRLMNQPAFPGISKIEYHLLMQHVRNLYQELADLDINGGTTLTTHTQKEETHPTVLLPKVNTENILLNDMPPAADEAVPDVKPAPEIKQAPGKQEIAEKVPPRPTEQFKVKEAAPLQDNTPLNERVKAPGTMNEKIKTTGGLHTRLSVKPLKELIDLNKRFVFVNELFKGNSEAFSAAIQQIDALTDYEHAEHYLQQNLILALNWDENAQATRLFKKLVKQKFGID